MDYNSSMRSQIKILTNLSICHLKNYSDLELAAIFSKDNNNLKILEKLLKTNKNEQTINELLMLTMQFDETSSIYAIKLLIKYGADINYTNGCWSAPIYCCIHLKNIKLIELLIENGVDINIKSSGFGNSPLMYLIAQSKEYDDLEIIKLLIRKGSQVNYRNMKGKTALMLCFKLRFNDLIKYDIIKLLLYNKADIYIQNNKGKNILKHQENNIEYQKCYSLIFNYRNLENDHFCECDIKFIYNHITSNF